MDRLKAMRQRDWARVFGILCAVVGLGLSVRGYPGADWDALILLLGALMLLRGAVEGPSPGRLDGLVRAGRIILFMFAFGAVNRAQTEVAGAVTGVLGNWILWAVAALLLALPFVRRGLPWGSGAKALREVAGIVAMGIAFWALFVWLTPEMVDLRALVAVAAVANAGPILRVATPAMAGLVLAVMLCCVVALPGAALWPVALGVAPAGLAFWALRRWGGRGAREN
ncbi:MAG: hypothetical protein C0427_07770 [Rhodobacter sp.]|nr:hypothetical protein [Rhodobacter sp.]